MRMIVAVLVLAWMLFGCVALGPLASGAGGMYTHKRIDTLESGKVEKLEERVKVLESGSRATGQ